MLLEDIQKWTTNVWHIPMEVVQDFERIVWFKASRDHMWIQAARDPKNKFLEMQYYITREEAD